MKEHYKNHQFYFFDIISKNIPEAQITAVYVANLLVTQQISINNQIVNTTQDIEIIDYAYYDAKPNRWVVFAKWKIV
jgi:hypothetical protein